MGYVIRDWDLGIRILEQSDISV